MYKIEHFSRQHSQQFLLFGDVRMAAASHLSKFVGYLFLKPCPVPFKRSRRSDQKEDRFSEKPSSENADSDFRLEPKRKVDLTEKLNVQESPNQKEKTSELELECSAQQWRYLAIFIDRAFWIWHVLNMTTVLLLFYFLMDA